MQTTVISTPSVQSTATANSTPVLRELSLSEMFAVSGGLPKGGWLAAGGVTVNGIESPLPKGGW